jgi:hypothetical protein
MASTTNAAVSKARLWLAIMKTFSFELPVAAVSGQL